MALLDKLRMRAGARTAKWGEMSRLQAAGGRSVKRLLVGAIGLLALFGCGAAKTTIPCADDQRCLSYAIAADIPVLDPHLSDLPEAGMIFRQIYDTLIYRGAGADEFLPGLARDWQVSPDGLVYTFHLRQDVAFHDGSAFKAESVARNIERIFHPDSGESKARELLGPLQLYEILDAYTIRLRLFEPHAALLDGLAQPFLGIASPAALERYDGLRYQYHQAGSGPFMLDDYLPGERIALRRFAGYAVNPAIYAPLTGGEIERIEFSIARDSVEASWSAAGSQRDIIDQISSLAAQTLAGAGRLTLLPTAIPGQTAQFVFNTASTRLAERDLRLALLLATNRIGIVDQVYLNTSPVAWAPLSRSTGYAHTGFIDKFGFDLAGAQALLAAAGYADSDNDGILERAADELSLTMLVPPWGQLPEVAAMLQRDWRQIGIDLQVAPAPGASQLAALIQSGEFDLLPVSNYGLDPGILNRVFRDDSLYSVSRAPDPALDDLLARAMQEQDPARRRSLYYEVQTRLMNAVMLLPIREPVRLRAVGAEVGGLRYDAYGFYPLLSNVTIAANPDARPRR